jgi:hypothetical protein
MEQFDCGILLPIACLDPVPHREEPSVYPENGAMGLKKKRNPHPGEALQIRNMAAEELKMLLPSLGGLGY